LNYVKLYGTHVTESGLEKFKAASGVSVDHKRGAFLGVGGIEIDGTCVISQVHPNSPAEKAGLLRDDVIVRFGKAAVGNFNSLMGLIAQRDVGENVEIEVSRRTNDDQGHPTLRISTIVKLAPWDMEPAVRNPRR
jgi:S1-C subfamily serine protease